MASTVISSSHDYAAQSAFHAPVLNTPAFTVSVELSKQQQVQLWRLFRNGLIALLMVLPYFLSL